MEESEVAFRCPSCQQQWSRSGLTARQVDILRFIAEEIHVEGRAPSFEEIAARFGFQSLATVNEHITNLERKQYIRREYNLARGITLIEPVP